MNEIEQAPASVEAGVYDVDDLAKEPLHSLEPGLIQDSGDLCDADCQDCD